MSLLLSESNPEVTAKCYTYTSMSLCGKGIDLDLSNQDIEELFLYYLTNTNIEPGDTRPEFLKRLQTLQIITGWGDQGRRIAEG